MDSVERGFAITAITGFMVLVVGVTWLIML